MLINNPCMITARLLPGIKIDDAFISIEYAGISKQDCRQIYRIFIDFADGSEYIDDSLMSGYGGGTLQQGLESCLSFLSACGESINYTRRTSRASDNADLYPSNVGEWAATHEDELSMAQCLLEETDDLIVE